jgi:hypothetical protein
MHSYTLVGKFYAFLDLVACEKLKATILFMSIRLSASDRLLTGRIFVKFYIGCL